MVDQELHNRIENLEDLCRQTLSAVNTLTTAVDSLRSDFQSFREEQRVHNTKTEALLQQIGTRVSSVEGRVGAVEVRLTAVEGAIFGHAANEDNYSQTA